MQWLLILAVEGGHIPADHPWAKVAVPLGALLFFGPIYLLLRSNLGTRRGYLVFASSLFGFLAFMGLFWAFGAPGTPQATGPQSLPGQEISEYVPTWVPFAPDSVVGQQPEYADLVAAYPEDFGEVPEDFQAEAELGAGEIQGFFSDPELFDEAEAPVPATYELVEIAYAEADNGYPVIAATFAETYQLTIGEDGNPVEPEGEVGEVIPDGRTVTMFGFFDAGNVIFPALVVFAIAGVLFVLHLVLLYRDEQRERREREALREPEPERVPAGA